jgi:hypothetical protein
MDHIEIDLKEIWREALCWIQVAQNSSVAEPCEHCNEPSVFMKGREHVGQLSE